jgi:adenosylhomocysteinase
MHIIDNIVQKYKKSKPLAGFKLGVCLHLTKETSVLVLAAKELGAEIAICSANPLSTQDEIAAFLMSKGISTFAWRGQTVREYKDCLKEIMSSRPDLLVDDGGELHTFAHKNYNRNMKVLGATEETTSGISRLKILVSKNRLRYPVIAVNNAVTKYLFDNQYGTGQSTIDGILRATALFLAGKHVVVCGYGWVGRGIATRARGMGAIVTVTEIDPLKALEACMDGFNVTKLSNALAIGNIFVTCTGQKKVISAKDIIKMKSGAILANAGHFDAEIDVKYLYSKDRFPVTVRKDLERFKLNDKHLYLLSKGRVVNLVSAEGHPPEIMALSFANQLLSLIYISKNYKKMRKEIIDVPGEIDQIIARYAVKSMKVEIDKLNKMQRRYQTG